MKKKCMIISLLLCSGIMFSGCGIKTPAGSVSLEYNADDKSGKTVITDDDGNKYELNFDSINDFMDVLLDSVALPDGVTTKDLKNSINKVLDDMNTTWSTLKTSSDKELKEFKKKLKAELKDSGVDVTDKELDSMLKSNGEE